MIALPPLVPLYVKVHLVPSEQRAAVMMCDPCPCPAVSLLCDLQQSLSLSRAIHKLIHSCIEEPTTRQALFGS